MTKPMASPRATPAKRKAPAAQVLLHDHPNFADLVRQVSQTKGIAPYLVEKDYWLMHSLWCLQQQGWVFELKGGTSLSKGFGLIQRFSEDIDLCIPPPPSLELKTGKNHDKPAHIAARLAFFDDLAHQMAQRTMPGIASIERDTAFDDAKSRSAGIRLIYPVRTGALGGIKDGILLELGFDDTAPNALCDISSWLVDVALATTVPIIDNRAKAVPCYSPAYTFVEKLQTVATKYRNQQQAPNGAFPKNFLRHYHDLYGLLASPAVQAFIGTPAYHARKQVRFPQADNLHIASNPAFTLPDANTRALYAAKYQETSSLYYAGQVPFEAILARIQQHIDRL